MKKLFAVLLFVIGCGGSAQTGGAVELVNATASDTIYCTMSLDFGIPGFELPPYISEDVLAGDSIMFKTATNANYVMEVYVNGTADNTLDIALVGGVSVKVTYDGTYTIE